MRFHRRRVTKVGPEVKHGLGAAEQGVSEAHSGATGRFSWRNAMTVRCRSSGSDPRWLYCLARVLQAYCDIAAPILPEVSKEHVEENARVRACRTGKLFQEGRSFLNFRSKIPAASFSLDSYRRVGEVGGEHFLKSLAGK